MVSPHDSRLIAAEVVRLQRQERWYKRWRFWAVFATVALLISFFSSKKSAPDNRHLAMVNVSGMISSESDIWRQLDKIDLQNTQGLLVLINSGGGTVGDSEHLYNRLRYLSERMPMELLVENQATSGAYLAALAADKIYAYHSSIVGSIGVVMQSINVESLMERLGVNVETFTTGEYKGYPSPFREMPEHVKEHLMDVMREDNDWFVQLVKSRRGISSSAAFDQAQVYTTRQGIKLGLIDGVSSRSEALERLIEKAGDWPVLDLEHDDSGNFLQGIIGRRVDFLPKNWAGWNLFAS